LTDKVIVVYSDIVLDGYFMVGLEDALVVVHVVSFEVPLDAIFEFAFLSLL